jgi:hypothetical protein
MLVTKPFCDHDKRERLDTKCRCHFSADLRRREHQGLTWALASETAIWSACLGYQVATLLTFCLSRRIPGLEKANRKVV